MGFTVLGPVSAEAAGAYVDLGNLRHQRLVAALVLAGRRGHTLEELADRVWDDANRPGSPTPVLRTYVSRIRRTIRSENSARDAEHLVTGHGRYSIGPGVPIDVDLFEDLARRGADDPDPRCSVIVLRRALDLWRGPAFGELADLEWVRASARRLEELRVGCIETLLHRMLETGASNEVAADATRLLEAHPYRERLRALQALALYRTGRQVEALRAIARHRVRLREELGIDLATELREIETAILRHDPSLHACDVGGYEGDNDFELPTERELEVAW